MKLMNSLQINVKTVVCRPALPKDTPDVMELTSKIWEGEDYVPMVWADWLADPQGLLAVAEYGGRVVGLGKLTLLAQGQWWLEGLRVHPEFEGRKIASHLHEYLVNVWLRTGDGTLGLGTASFRVPVQHLCERTGFEKIGEYTTYLAPVLRQGPSDTRLSSFIKLTLEDVPRAFEWVESSSSLGLSFGLMDLGWQWARPLPNHLAGAVKEGMAWWWRPEMAGDQASPAAGLLVAGEDQEGEQTRPYLHLVACPPEAMASCLKDFRRFAAELGYEQVAWMAPLHPDLQPALLAAGFERDWDASIYIYEKQR
jgi:GNAT superfamily N-acetyltransferase